MKVVHVYKDFDPPVHGGIERHVALMCRYQRQWCEVEALVCSRSLLTRRTLRDGIPVTEVGEWGRFQSAPVSPAFPWHLRRIPAEVMVVQCPNPTAEVACLLGRPDAAIVVRYQSDVVRQAAAMRLYRPLFLRFLQRADLILPSSPQYLQSSPVLSRFKDKSVVVPLGIVPEEFDAPDVERVRMLREQYGGDYVLFSGVHRYYKGIPWLVRAAPAIRASVVIAGDGPERESCIALAKQLGVQAYFPGALAQEDLVAHLHGCAVFAFPSVERSEAFGLSMLEAHACRKPVVATRLGTGVEYVNEHGVTGLNVAPRDAQALAEALNLLLADPARREAMGDIARERVETQFHARRVARRELDLYEQALHDRNARASRVAL